jgi:hypothetical protein
MKFHFLNVFKRKTDDRIDLSSGFEWFFDFYGTTDCISAKVEEFLGHTRQAKIAFSNIRFFKHSHKLDNPFSKNSIHKPSLCLCLV